MLGPVIYMIHDSDKSQQAVNVQKMFFCFFSLIMSSAGKICGVGALRFKQCMRGCYVPCDCCICFT